MSTPFNADYYRRQRKVIELIPSERDRQDDTWGPLPRFLTSHDWLAILVEEVGEVVKGIVEADKTSWPMLREELVQSAAVAVAAIEDMDAQYGGPEPATSGGAEVRR